MLNNGCVTLYHYNELHEKWERTSFPEASIYRQSSASASAGNFAPDNYCVIRIPYTKDISVSIGDYIYTGNSRQNEPSAGICLKVTSFSHNYRGLSPHLKIICA